eukprot:TRINITY_DN11581_c0_g1_i2.p1 TRINITY_DN11581_c0_g1~~TRINITY_DN11581_c0_g1_i2.p1  ORF type:complete len:335 (-),score=45.82 TRINITY_DN11581_c0_g1_i2:6-986(-)
MALQFCSRLIPRLAASQHKGSCGRVGVLGGSEDFTGAPYFAAYTALRMGVDLAYVFCAPPAATAIKSYTPELIVLPLLKGPQDAGFESVERTTDAICAKLGFLHALVIGPGLGRSETALAVVSQLLARIAAEFPKLAVIIDADGLWLVTQQPSVLHTLPHVILTPNRMELTRLCGAVSVEVPQWEDEKRAEYISAVKRLAATLGDNVTIVAKGQCDVMATAREALSCDAPGSQRRCGGQGDLLSGAVSTFMAWSSIVEGGAQKPLDACFAACFFIRCVANRSWVTHKRSVTANDMLGIVGPTFEELWPTPAAAGDPRNVAAPALHS